MNDFVHKEKFTCVKKGKEACCPEAHDVLRSVVFANQDSSKAVEFSELSKSVFSNFEVGEEFFVEVKRASK